jgi:hypothetical protein
MYPVVKLLFIPPRDSGEGGPRFCAVGGALASMLVMKWQDFPHRPRPLHHTSCGPPPPLSRGRISEIVPAMRLHPQRCHALAMALPQTRHFHFAPPDNEGSGAPNGAPCLLPGTAGENCTRYQVQPRPVLPGRSPFGAPLRIDGTCVLPRPGPALPGITGYKREFCTPSPAPVQRAPRSPNTCRTGMMPRPPANRSDEPLPAEPAPAPSVGVTG